MASQALEAGVLEGWARKETPLLWLTATR